MKYFVIKVHVQQRKQYLVWEQSKDRFYGKETHGPGMVEYGWTVGFETPQEAEQMVQRLKNADNKSRGEA